MQQRIYQNSMIFYFQDSFYSQDKINKKIGGDWRILQMLCIDYASNGQGTAYYGFLYDLPFQ